MKNKHTEAQVRYSVLHGDSPRIRELLLTKNQVSLVRTVRLLGAITASILSDMEEISIQNASAKLKKLYNSGYLSRSEETAESGGIEFIYYINTEGGFLNENH